MDEQSPVSRVRVNRAGSIFIGGAAAAAIAAPFVEGTGIFGYGQIARTVQSPNVEEEEEEEEEEESPTYDDLAQLVDDLAATCEVGIATEAALRGEIETLREALRGQQETLDRIDSIAKQHDAEVVSESDLRADTILLSEENARLRAAISARSRSPSSSPARTAVSVQQTEPLEPDAARNLEELTAKVDALQARLSLRDTELEAALSMHENQRRAIDALKRGATLGSFTGYPSSSSPHAESARSEYESKASSPLQPLPQQRTPPSTRCGDHVDISPIVRVTRDGCVYIR